MDQQDDIRAKLEALFARGATDGERAAVGAALDRLNNRLGPGTQEPKTEFQ